MNINATLLVQAGNFFIAYLLFRYILLKPGYEALCQKQAYQKTLEDTIVQDAQAIEATRERQQNAWAEFRAWCGEYRPAWIERALLFRGISRAIQPKEVSKKEKEQVRNQLMNVMVTAIRKRYE